MDGQAQRQEEGRDLWRGANKKMSIYTVHVNGGGEVYCGKNPDRMEMRIRKE